MFKKIKKKQLQNPVVVIHKNMKSDFIES